MTQPILIHTMIAHQWHCDHFGHLNVRHYAAAFDDAVFVFWSQMGLVIPEKGRPGEVPVTAELKLSFSQEVAAGDVTNIYASVVRVGTKSVSLKFEMKQANTGTLMATCETVEVFFDVFARQSARIPASILQNLQGLDLSSTR